MWVSNQVCGSFSELMAFTLPSFSSCDWTHWGLTPLPACSSWNHGSLSPPPVWFACFTDERWSSCQSFVHSHCLTRLVLHVPNSQHLSSPIPHFTTLLHKVTRSHCRLRSVAMRMPWQPWRTAHGAHVSKAVMDWTLGAERRNYTFRTFFIILVAEQCDGRMDREGQCELSDIFSHTNARVTAG